YKHLFEATQKSVQVAFALAEKKNRVGHQLSRAVVRDIAAALDGDDGNLAGAKDIAGFCRTPERDDVGMLDENQRIRNAVCLSGCDEVLLQLQDLAIVAQPQVLNACRFRRGATLCGVDPSGRSGSAAARRR